MATHHLSLLFLLSAAVLTTTTPSPISIPTPTPLPTLTPAPNPSTNTTTIPPSPPPAPALTTTSSPAPNTAPEPSTNTTKQPPLLPPAPEIMLTPFQTPAPKPSINNTTQLPAPPSAPVTEAPPAEPTQDLRLHSQQQLNRIMDALIGAGDSNSWANILSVADPSMFPLSATLFIPADEGLYPSATATVDPYIFPYHIVPQRLTFAELRRFKVFTRLPTLLPAKSILITNNSFSNFTLDGSLLSHPDIYTTAAIAVHGVATLMDYSVYGDGGGLKPPKQEVHVHPSPPPPPGKFEPASDMIDHHGESDAACLCTEVWTVFLVVFVVFASKIHRINLAR